MKILAFTGSNSSNSINKELLKITSEKILSEVNTIDLRAYNIPIYSMDIETSTGIPQGVKDLAEEIAKHQAFIVSSAEHNGMPTAFFKNILDWLSRENSKFLGVDSPILLLSTSPGPGGAANHLSIIEKTLGYFGGKVIGKYSLKSFHNHVKDGVLTSEEENHLLTQEIEKFQSVIF